MPEQNNFTNKELLIRIDERQQNLCKEVAEIKKILSEKVDFDEEYKEMARRVNELWDWRNKVLGMATMAGAATSLVFNLVLKVISVYAR